MGVDSNTDWHAPLPDDEAEVSFQKFLAAIDRKEAKLEQEIIGVGVKPDTIMISWELPYYNILRKRLADRGTFGSTLR